MLSKISVKWLSDGGYFCKIVPSWTCDMVLNTPLTIFFIGINIVLMLMLVAMAEEELTWSIIIPYLYRCYKHICGLDELFAVKVDKHVLFLLKFVLN